jgi:hypothetical protein
MYLHPQGELKQDPCEWCQTLTNTRVGSVTKLELRNRFLTGNLSELLQALAPLGRYGLAVLNLQDNRIRGEIPRQLNNTLPDLTVLNLGSNEGGHVGRRGLSRA